MKGLINNIMDKTVLNKFPELKTERLRLRKLKLSDDEVIYSFHSDLANRKYIDRPPPKNILASREFVREINRGVKAKEWVYWGIELKKEKKMIGTICLWHFSEKNNSIELGYELGSSFQRKGYMSEAIKVVIDFAFTSLKANVIKAYTHCKNEASKRALEKFNFRKEKDIEEKYANKKGTYKMSVFILSNY